MDSSKYLHHVLVQPSALICALSCAFASGSGKKDLVVLRSGLLEAYSVEGENEHTQLFLIASYVLPPGARRMCSFFSSKEGRDLVVVSSGDQLLYLAYDTVLREIVIRTKLSISFTGGFQFLESPNRKAGNFVVCWSSTGTVFLLHESSLDTCLTVRGLPAIHEIIDLAITSCVSKDIMTSLGLLPDSLLLSILWTDSSHSAYVQILSLTIPPSDSILSQSPMVKDVTRKLPIQARYSFIRPFGRNNFIAVGPSAFFLLTPKTTDVTPILHPCAAPSSLSQPWYGSSSCPKTLFMHDKSGLLIELNVSDDAASGTGGTGEGTGSTVLMRCWGVISSSIYSVLLQQHLLFICSYSTPSMLLYVNWNTCDHVTFSAHGVSALLDDSDEQSITAGEGSFGQESVPAARHDNAGSRTELVEPHTFKHLSASILASNSNLQCGVPVVLAQLTHKGPIVDVCYVAAQPDLMFQHSFIKLETPLLSSDVPLQPGADYSCASSGAGPDFFAPRKRTAKGSNNSAKTGGVFINIVNSGANTLCLSDLVAWTFQRTRYFGVLQLETQAHNTMSRAAPLSESTIYTISGFDSSGFLNMYQNRISYNCTASVKLDGLVSLVELAQDFFLARIYNKKICKYGCILLRLRRNKTYSIDFLKMNTEQYDLYGSTIHQLKAYDDADSKTIGARVNTALVMVGTAFDSSILEIDIGTGKDSCLYSVAVGDLLSTAVSLTDESNTLSLKEMPKGYVDTVTITTCSVSPDCTKIVYALSNGYLITAQFSAKTEQIVIIKCKKFTVSEAFLPPESIFTSKIYSARISDEGCVCICCMGIPYVFLLDIHLNHVFERGSSDVLYLSPQQPQSSVSFSMHSSLDSCINPVTMKNTSAKDQIEENTLASIMAGSVVQPSDNLSLFVQLSDTCTCLEEDRGTGSEKPKFAACPFPHTAALNLSPPTDIVLVGPNCLVVSFLGGIVQIYTIKRTEIGNKGYFIVEDMHLFTFADTDVASLYLLKRGQKLSNEIGTRRSTAELYVYTAAQAAVMRITVTLERDPCPSNVTRGAVHTPDKNRDKQETGATSLSADLFPLLSTWLSLSIDISYCTDTFSIVLPLNPTSSASFSHVLNTPQDRTPISDTNLNDISDSEGATLAQLDMCIVYRADNGALSLAARTTSCIACKSARIDGLPRRLAHLTHYGLVCVGFHMPYTSPPAAAKHLGAGDEKRLGEIPSVIDLSRHGNSKDGSVNPTSSSVHEHGSASEEHDSSIEYYSYNNATRTFEALSSESYTFGTVGRSLAETMRFQGSCAALKLFTYNLQHVLTVQLPENANISGLQYIPLRDDTLPFLVITYNLPSSKSMDAEDGVLAVYKLAVEYVPEEQLSLELVASYEFSDHTIYDVVPYTNYRVAISIGTALVILALIGSDDLIGEDAATGVIDFCPSYALGKSAISTTYQLLEVYSCTGPALLLKVSAAHSQIALLDILKGVTLMNDTLNMARTPLERPRLVVQSQLLQRMIPSCIYQVSTDGPLFVADRAGYIHILDVHQTQGMKVVASHYVGEQVVAFAPACPSSDLARLNKWDPQASYIAANTYAPIIYITIGGQIGVLMKISAPCSTLLRSVENAMQRSYPSRIDVDVPADLNFIHGFSNLADEKKEFIVAGLRSAKFSDLTVADLADIIGSVAELATPW